MANQHTAAKAAQKPATPAPAAPQTGEQEQTEQQAPRTSIYEAGEGDARQQGDIVPSRFRPVYRKLNEQEIVLHDAIKQKAIELEALYAEITSERRAVTGYQDKALEALELSVMWAIKGVTA